MRVIPSLRIERRDKSSGLMIAVVSGLALLVAFLAAALIFWAYGINPLRAYAVIVKDSLGSGYALTGTVRRALPLLVTGVGLALAFRVSFWNIGAEGQILAGAAGATWVVLFSGLSGSTALWLAFPAGFLAGALWGGIAAVLRSRREVNEIISTLMLNSIAAYIVVYLVHGPWQGETVQGYALTDIFPREVWLATIGHTRIAIVMVAIGLLAAGLVYLLVVSTTAGYEAQVFGENPKAGRYAGMNYGRVVLLVMFISGGLAGLTGVGEVLGVQHRLQSPGQISLGYGFTAIIVAWLARTNPLAVIPASIFFGALLSGGVALKIEFGIPYQVTSLFNGLILLFLVGGERLIKYRLSMTWRAGKRRKGKGGTA